MTCTDTFTGMATGSIAQDMYVWSRAQQTVVYSGSRPIMLDLGTAGLQTQNHDMVRNISGTNQEPTKVSSKMVNVDQKQGPLDPS